MTLFHALDGVPEFSGLPFPHPPIEALFATAALLRAHLRCKRVFEQDHKTVVTLFAPEVLIACSISTATSPESLRYSSPLTAASIRSPSHHSFNVNIISALTQLRFSWAGCGRGPRFRIELLLWFSSTYHPSWGGLLKFINSKMRDYLEIGVSFLYGR